MKTDNHKKEGSKRTEKNALTYYTSSILTMWSSRIAIQPCTDIRFEKSLVGYLKRAMKRYTSFTTEA
jgi:hypothetical protein